MTYGTHAHDYLRAGHRGILPLPPGKKANPPDGYTGKAGVMPSAADVQAFAEDHPAGNLAVRFDLGQCGYDLDAHSGKSGDETTAKLEAALGPLPKTMVTTARPLPSGVRCYRLPDSEPAKMRDPGPGVEILHYGWRYAVVWPSTNPDAGGAPYRWFDMRTGEYLDRVPRPDEWAMMPDAWVDYLRNGTQTDKTDADLDTVTRWLQALPTGDGCDDRIRDVLEEWRGAHKAGSRHDAALRASMRLVALGANGHRGISAALATIRDVFVPAVTDRDRDGSTEWRRMLVGAVQTVIGEHPDPATACACPTLLDPGTPNERLVVGKPARINPPQQTSTVDLDDIIAAAREYLDLPDPAPLLATLAVAATRDLEDEPVWLLLVGAPSGGKTETTRVLDDVADARLDDVSAAGMLSWKGGKKPEAVGVLTRVPSPNALVTFGDLSSLLASSDRGGRDATFALLRKCYDGHVTRSLGNAPAPLTWEGRLSIVAAVTDAIDNYASHADALGPRWLYLRIAPRDTAARRRAAAAARRGGLGQARDKLRQLATQAVRAATATVNSLDLPDELDEAIEDAALVCCWGRAAVPRHGYGRREIDGLPIIEEPPRIIRQLRGLARGALALGMDTPDVEQLCRRVALDSMPAVRRQVLDVLADGEALTTTAVAREADGGMHRHVARRQLEELEAIGVVACRREGQEPGDDESDRRIATWRLDAQDGALVAQVIHTYVAGVARKVGTHPPSPPNKEENSLQEQEGYVPTLRATPRDDDRGAA